MTKRTAALASLFALALAAAGAAQAQAPLDGDVLGGGGASTITYSPAAAERLKPLQAHGLDLGAASGVAYHTVERGGFRVVVTLAQRGEDATRHCHVVQLWPVRDGRAKLTGWHPAPPPIPAIAFRPR